MRVLIEDNKYGQELWAASTEEELYASAIAILSDRHEYFYQEDVPEPLEIDLDSIPEALHEEAKRKLDSNKRDIAYAEQVNREYDEFIRAVDGKDGKLAWEILQKRSGYEYENVYLEDVRNPLKEK